MNEREEDIEDRDELRAIAHKKALEKFPKSGARLRYRGDPRDWFTNIVANAERELRVGEIYTLKSLELGRSWCTVTLEETGETEYSLSFFDVFSESEERFKHLAED